MHLQVPNSRLILIGIANSINLTERALPRLQAMGCRPTLVTFPSYSSLQLECLLQQRLAALPGPVIVPQAVRLAAKKACHDPFAVSSSSGAVCVGSDKDSLLA
jgi:cell division control protein 6